MLFFKVTKNSNVGYIGDRINHVTPLRSDLELQLPDNLSVNLQEVKMLLKNYMTKNILVFLC